MICFPMIIQPCKLDPFLSQFQSCLVVFMHIDIFLTLSSYGYVWTYWDDFSSFSVACLFPTSLNPEILEGILGSGQHKYKL